MTELDVSLRGTRLDSVINKALKVKCFGIFKAGGIGPVASKSLAVS